LGLKQARQRLEETNKSGERFTRNNRGVESGSRRSWAAANKGNPRRQWEKRKRRCHGKATGGLASLRDQRADSFADKKNWSEKD